MTATAQRILVTGVAGFIASRVAALLLEQGHPVIGVDNLNEAYDIRLKEWRLASLQKHPDFTFHPLDITDRDALQALFHSAGEDHPPFHAVVNLAARAGVRQSVADPWIYLETNVTGTLNLLERCREHGVQRFVLASTSSLYAGGTMPYQEDQSTDRPLSPYAASKKAAEALCHVYHALHSLGVVVLRYFTVYGPAGRPDMSPFRFVQWIFEERPVTVYGDGSQSRDFTYVDDVARGTVAALRYLEDRDCPAYEVINLGSDRPIGLMEVIRLIEDLVGKEARLEHRPRHPADAPATWADIGKARRLLGWQPQTPFQEGMERLVAWYRENRSWARTIETGP